MNKDSRQPGMDIISIFDFYPVTDVARKYTLSAMRTDFRFPIKLSFNLPIFNTIRLALHIVAMEKRIGHADMYECPRWTKTPFASWLNFVMTPPVSTQGSAADFC
jgi:hypothetical protein